MRTPLSSGLAAASLGLLVAGLAFRSWQVVLLALPPVIVLALGSLFPPARPRLGALRTRSGDRAEAGRGGGPGAGEPTPGARPPLVRRGFSPTAGRGDGVLGRPRVSRGR